MAIDNLGRALEKHEGGTRASQYNGEPSVMGELTADPAGVPSREADLARLATVEAKKRPGDVRFAGEVLSHNILWLSPPPRLEPAGTAPAHDNE